MKPFLTIPGHGLFRPIPDMIEVDRELGSIEWPPVAEIFSGSDYVVPGLERHARSPIRVHSVSGSGRR